MAEGNTIPNAVIGAVVTVLTAGIVPASPLLGGAVAGYLEGGERDDGVRVGVYAGLIAMIPAIVVVFFVSSLVGVFGLGFGAFAGPPGLGVLGIIGTIFLFFALIVGLLVIVGLSAAGGWIGNYVKYDADL